MRLIPTVATTVATILCSVICAAALASDATAIAPATTPVTSPDPAPTLTRADLETWLDGLLPYSMGTGDIAGGVVAVVKNGEILLQKGYGYADVATKKPVDPELTLFRAGSVGKLFTHTAVMQQVERGKLDLNQDIAKYLDVPVPDAFGKPVKLYDLMTHTGGFEERVRHMMAADTSAFLTIEDYVKGTQPTRIFPPGEIPSYCNYCATLEGYIVQRASGESYDDYLDAHIFGPLGMKHSTFRQPLPENLAANMSQGYKTASSPAKYFELISQAPAGSISTTGADMARFMIGHLQALKGGAPELLSAATAQRMQTTMFRATPPSLGMAIGFFERDRNGHRIREHGGDTQFFHSSLTIYIDDGVGLFFSFNSSGKDGAVYKLRDALSEQFTDRYFPAPLPDEPALATAVEHARLVAGNYAASRRADNTFFKLIALLGQTQINANADGTIEVPALSVLNGEPKRWREVQPFVWREVGGRELLSAKMQDGRVKMIGADTFGGVMTFMPVPGGLSAAWILPAAAIAVGVLLLTAIAWPVTAVMRRRRGVVLGLAPRDLAIYRAVRITALLQVVFVFGWFLIVQAGSNDLAAYDGRLDAWFLILAALGAIGAVGAAVALWNAWLAFSTQRGWKSVTWSTAIAGAALFITWFGFVFNLIRFSVAY